MSHIHDHAHGHTHQHHGTGNIRTAFWLNLGFTVMEFAGGMVTNSVAILSDALHDLGDSLSLGMAWYFQKKAGKKKDTVYTYGYGRFSLVGALINSIILIVGSVFMLTEAVPRIFNPEPSDARGMFFLAILGILVNGAAVFRLKKGESLNERAVMLHLMEDVLGWAAVLLGSAVMFFTGWEFIDPLLSIGITMFILYNVFGNLKGVFRVILQGTPEHINLEEIRLKIAQLEGVSEVHDLHLWTVDGRYNVMSLHAVLNEGVDRARIKQEIRHELHHQDIEHVTIETEYISEGCTMKEC
jgi:cobalt-zinc-cadmium efflux system protein